MGREIKFRVWKHRKVYKNGVSLGGEMDYDPHVWRGDYSLNDRFLGFDDSKEYEIMQYTGLKDDNGKDIYEGDVIKIEEDAEEPINCGCGVVEWNNIACFRDVSNIREPLGDVNYNYCIEIIGNIYENPNLLEQAK